MKKSRAQQVMDEVNAMVNDGKRWVLKVPPSKPSKRKPWKRKPDYTLTVENMVVTKVVKHRKKK